MDVPLFLPGTSVPLPLVMRLSLQQEVAVVRDLERMLLVARVGVGGLHSRVDHETCPAVLAIAGFY